MTDKPIITKQQLLDDLNKAGITNGAILAVHSSLKSIGLVEAGPKTVCETLIEAVGPDGTLLLPLFSGIPEGRTIDLRTEPSKVGAITETFRKMPGVIRSHNPTHSVGVIGKHAQRIADTHLNTTQLGENSPFHELAKMGGTVLHIGCSFSSCSIVHVAECIAKVPYLDIPWPGCTNPTEYITSDGEEKVLDSNESPGDGAGFRTVQWEMDRRGILKHCKIGEADSVYALGSEIIDVAVEMLERDPAAVLCHKDKCPVCHQSHDRVWEMLKG